MPRRPAISRKDRSRLFTLYGGECYLCGGQITAQAEAWEIEHVIPWELTHDNTDDNLRLVHFACHKVKTAADIRQIRKSDRQRDRHTGVMPPSRHPMPCGRSSRFKKCMDGRVVERRKVKRVHREAAE